MHWIVTIVRCSILPGGECSVDEVNVFRVGVVSFRWRHHLLLVERSRARELWVGALVAEVAASAMVAQPVLARIPSTTVSCVGLLVVLARVGGLASAAGRADERLVEERLEHVEVR